MADYFQHKYRIPSARASWHDYNGGAYFITLCTAERKHYFGEIVSSYEEEMPVMEYSLIGGYVDDCIRKIELLHSDIEVPVYTIMPNHIHLIVVVHGEVSIVETSHMTVETPQCDVSTMDGVKRNKQEIANSCGRLSHVLSQFKTVVTKYAKRNNVEFGWQSRFYDHIIRNRNEMKRVSEYIQNNIYNWTVDEFYIMK